MRLAYLSEREMLDLSIVSPVYNEEDNLFELHEELKDVLDELEMEYEIIFVDDGSSDDSYRIMKELAEKDEAFRAVKLRKNFGQSSALQAGFDESKGDVVISMDSDMQNDPKDIPKLLKKLDESWDCVVGWRHEREDPLGKRIFSKVSSWLRRIYLGTKLHDFGCTLKAFKRECLNELKLSGEMHRYIPSLLRWRGFDVTEVKVNHRERKHGETKYGGIRVFKGFMDMINVWFWRKFHGRPLHLFGGLGILSAFIGLVAAWLAIYWKIFEGITFTSTPLPLFSVFMVLAGALLFVSGLLADVMLKNYYSVEEKSTYSVKEVTD